ncbi:MAG TPA: molybdopterin-dependent oxidoreductase [Dokdonella sp.]|uniref:molybdopterin-dependent oxidoreductase n=1 Tax=Dokdonella sp. TaxID=2291710 RepID=UPI002BD5CD19|nr:molybdopterin-dependent oxidoreductase [Dokdonella sp.]HOX72702.1 molybdopterin-dependent oxidoreductase [Dokdonella sp.]
MTDQHRRQLADHASQVAIRPRWMVAFALALTLGGLGPASGALAEKPDRAVPDEHPNVAKIVVAGEVSRPLETDIAALSKLPRTSVTASAHGVEGRWQGVALIEILRAAGAPVDEALRGRNLSLYVRVTAADGYRVVFALAELDPKFRDDRTILADHEGDQPLGADQGPFRIIAPAEKRPGRWVRQVTRIDVLRAPD